MAEFEEFERERSRLGKRDQQELVALLSSREPREVDGLKACTTSRRVRALLEFYNPIAKAEEAEIWKFQSQHSMTRGLDEVPEEELVEDAGLLDEAVLAKRRTRSQKLSISTVEL